LPTYTRAFLFANGPVKDLLFISKAIQKTDLLIAVDGGLKHMRKIGKHPHILIGDLDSIAKQEFHLLENERVDIRKFPIQKDETDLELALGILPEFNIRKAIISGATGDRVDHTLGNIHLLLQNQKTLDLVLDDGQQEVFIIKKHALIHGKPNDIVSLIPLEEKVTGITTSQLVYPLKHEKLYLAGTRGISNVMLGKTAEVQKKRGQLLCVHLRV
jgi:thiamine pyrophosphokinase